MDPYNKHSETQLKVLAIIPMIVGPLSLIGSSTILYMIYLRKERRLYHNLMMMISSVDVLSSGVTMFGTLPVPESTGVPFARGNVATCEFQGFFNQLSVSNMFYNMFLMVVFLKIIVRYGAKEEALSDRYATLIHIFSLGVPILLGFAGVFLDIFNPVPDMGLTRCYIAPYPPGCDVDDTIECSRGANYVGFLVFFALIPCLCSLIGMFGSIILIFLTIRGNARRSQRLSQHNIQNTNRTISNQAIIYGIFFFNTYVWILINPLVDIILPPDSENDGFTFRTFCRYAGTTFYGWQGFFNFFIYVRPRYVRIRSYRDDKSSWWAFKEAVIGVKLEDSRYRTMSFSRGKPSKNDSSSGPKLSLGEQPSKSFVVARNDSTCTTTTNNVISQSFRVEGGGVCDHSSVGMSSHLDRSPSTDTNKMENASSSRGNSIRIKPDDSLVSTSPLLDTVVSTDVRDEAR